MKSTPSHSKRVAFFGIMLALALTASYIESLIPFYFGVPGMKLGLCNVIVVVIMYLRRPWDALALNILRIVLAGFMFGNAFSIIYSLAGGLLSFAVMFILKKTRRFSIIGVSVAGGFSHNIGQLILACAIVENYRLIFYGPALIVCGVITGFLVGILASEILPRINNINIR